MRMFQAQEINIALDDYYISFSWSASCYTSHVHCNVACFLSRFQGPTSSARLAPRADHLKRKKTRVKKKHHNALSNSRIKAFKGSD